MKDISLYIHIPFCRSKCLYCDFISFAQSEALMDEYIDLLKKELYLYSSENNYNIKTIYIGGGTPSMLNINHIDKIVNCVYKYFHCSIVEFTIECNPDSLNAEKLKFYTKSGITRISLGIQTFNDKILKTIGRRHNREKALYIIDLTKKYFNNINVDLMTGLPYENDKDGLESIKILIDKDIPHISLYYLILEENTPLYTLINTNKLTLPNEDDCIKRYHNMLNAMYSKGIKRYEVSNFAKNGFICKHNMAYWKLKEYIGAGISSHGFIDNIRYENAKTFNDYKDFILNNKKPINKKNKISCTESQFEYIMLGFRLTHGIDINEFNTKYNIDFIKKYNNKLTELKEYLNINNNNISIKPQYMDIMNSIIVEFM